MKKLVVACIFCLLPVAAYGEESLPEGFSFSCVPHQPVEAKPGEPAKFSNLGFIRINAILIAPTDMTLERFSVDIPDNSYIKPELLDPENPRDKNLFVTITPLLKTKNLLKVNIKGSGGGKSNVKRDGKKFKRYSGKFSIDIPVPDEIMKKEISDFIDLTHPSMIKSFKKELIKKKSEDPGFNKEQFEKQILLILDKNRMKENFQRMYRKNQAGLYEIQCKYSVQSEGVWNGTIEAKPFIIEVTDDGGFWDKQNKEFKLQQEEKARKEEEAYK